MVRLTTGYTSVVVSSAGVPHRAIKRSGVTVSVAFVMRVFARFFEPLRCLYNDELCQKEADNDEDNASGHDPRLLDACEFHSACPHHRSARPLWRRNFAGCCETVTSLWEAMQASERSVRLWRAFGEKKPIGKSRAVRNLPERRE